MAYEHLNEARTMIDERNDEQSGLSSGKLITSLAHAPFPGRPAARLIPPDAIGVGKGAG